MLDTDVQRAYDLAKIEFRPRFTPVVKVLKAAGPSSIRSIATSTSLSHSAISQTVAQMAKFDLVTFVTSRDERERVVTPTARLTEMLPAIARRWAATNAAAEALDQQLSHPLSKLVAEAIAALEVTSFSDRIAAQSDSGETERC